MMRFLILLGLTLAASAAPAAPPAMRSPVLVDTETRALVLAEMRGLLEGVAGITQALSREDLEAVARHARALGTGMTGDLPAASMQRLPPQFRRMGLAMHRAFDQLALDAEQLGDPSHSLGQLGAVLQGCVACHARFRLDPAP